MPKPRTKFEPATAPVEPEAWRPSKFLTAITLEKDPAKWGRDCRQCQAFVEAWRQRGLAPVASAGHVGRPRMLLDPLALHQITPFTARLLHHLHGYPGDIDEHLREQGLAGLLLAVHALRPYFRRDDAAWGEPGVISARRWRNDVQYQAVRRFLAAALKLDPRTLRRRFDERVYWGSL